MGSVTASTGSITAGNDVAISHKGNNGSNTHINVAATPGPSDHWPSKTDIIYPPGSNKIMLTVQHPLLKAVFQDAFERIHVAMVFHNAFTNAYKTAEMITESLITAAELNKRATNIHNRLVVDSDYSTTMTCLVTTRGDTSLRTRHQSCLLAWYGKEVQYIWTLSAVL